MLFPAILSHKYRDQPVGTGFSYATDDYVINEAGVAADMYIFIQSFLQKFPQYSKLPFFIIGESYGGTG
jgi:cathepsin A (carboxypeptidase C)